jgi:type II secretory pathway component PulJ
MINNFHKKIRNQMSGGFTLVETVIYVVLFALLSLFLIYTLLVMLKSYTEVRVNDDILDAAHTSMERMSREIRGAINASTATSGLLILNTTDASSTAKTVQFDVASSTIRFTDNGTLSGNLTGAQAAVTSLIFRKITTTGGEAIRIEMSIKSLRSLSSKTILFTDTISERGSY